MDCEPTHQCSIYSICRAVSRMIILEEGHQEHCRWIIQRFLLPDAVTIPSAE